VDFLPDLLPISWDVTGVSGTGAGRKPAPVLNGTFPQRFRKPLGVQAPPGFKSLPLRLRDEDPAARRPAPLATNRHLGTAIWGPDDPQRRFSRRSASSRNRTPARSTLRRVVAEDECPARDMSASGGVPTAPAEAGNRREAGLTLQSESGHGSTRTSRRVARHVRGRRSRRPSGRK